MAKFKVKRAALFMSSTSIVKDLEVDQGLSTKSGLSTFDGGLTATSTVILSGTTTLSGTTELSGATTFSGDTTVSGSVNQTGAFTAASTFTVTGCAIIGAGGTAIAEMLAGSGELVIGALASSATSAASFTVEGLTVAHKIFITSACLSACITAACVFTGAATCDLVVQLTNQTDEAVAAGTCAIYYIAVLDK